MAAAAFFVLVGGSLQRVGLQAYVTVLIFLAAMFALPCTLLIGPAGKSGERELVNPPKTLIPLPLWGFATWALVSAIQQHTEAGAQNVLVYLSFVAVMALAAVWASARSPVALLRWVRAASVVSAVLYLTAVALTGPGNSIFYQARVYGATVWIGMVAAVTLAGRSRLGYGIPLLLLVSCLLSLSRTATIVCALLFLALAAKNNRRGTVRRFILLAAAVVYGGLLLFERFQPLRDRFTDNDNQQIGGLLIGTSGRAQLWTITWDSIKEAPWVGHGLGSADRLISGIFGQDYIGHPHNDYLRIWHDLGIVGLVLWLSAMLVLGFGAYRRWRSATQEADRAAHLAAMLAVLGLSLFAVTGNLLTYIFVQVPVAVITGTSLGRAGSLRDDDSRSRRAMHPSDLGRPGPGPVPEWGTG
jgi:O-antigen ligase